MVPTINTLVAEIEGSTLQVPNPITGIVSQLHLILIFTT